MSQRAFHGKFTALIPAISFAGKSWGGLIKWDNNPGSITVPDGTDRGDTTIVSGVLLEIQDLGDGRKILWFKRTAQRFSYTKVVAPGDSQEIEYDAFMGGNICQNIEPWRGYSWNNDRSMRGCDSLDRVEPGHVAWWEGRGFEVLEIRPFGKRPSSVSFGAETPSPTVSYYDVDINNLILSYPDERSADSPDAVPYFTPEDTGLYADCGVYGVFGTATRKTFTTPAGASDPEYYPDDASFSTSAAEYWFDPVTKQFRIGSGTATVGNDLTVVYYHRDIRMLTGEDLVVYTLEGSGTGYGVTDQLALMHSLTRGDFDLQFFIYKGGTNNFGTGAIEWRVGTGAAAQLVTMRWTEDFITSVKKRDGESATLEDVSFTANGTGFGPDYFLVRIRKVGNTLTLFWQDQDDVSATTAATIVLTDVEEETSGFVGLATWDDNGIKLLGWDGEDCRVHEIGGGEGIISRQVIDVYTDVEFEKTFTLPATEAITAVDVTGGGDFAMTESATDRRDTYELPTSTTITFKSEASGARVRVTQAAPVSVPGSTGRIPRLGGTVNMATAGEDGISASTNPDENVANWYDGVVINDPHDEMAATEGETITFKNNLFASETAPLVVSYDVKNRVSNWATVPAEDQLSRWAEGYTLISSTLLATLPETGLVCFKAEGAIYYQAGNMDARQVNELDEVLEAWDNHHIGLSMAGGEVASVKGLTGGMFVGPTSKGCIVVSGATDFVNTGVAWGQRRIDLGRPYRFDPPSIKPPYPFWHEGLYFDASVRAEGSDEVITCGTHSFEVRNLIVPGAFWYTVSPIGSIAPTDNPLYQNHAGAILGDPAAVGFGGQIVYAYFQFQGQAFMPPEELKRIFGGCTCIEALVEVSFSGLRTREIYSYENDNTGIDSYLRRRRIVNGEVAVDYERTAGGSVILDVVTPEAEDLYGGDVSFALVGRQRISANVENHDGTFSPLPSHVYSYLGSTTAFATESGTTSVVDVAPLINALIADRGSNLTDYMLWPTVGGVAPGSSAHALGDYLKSLMPSDLSANIIETVGHNTRIESEGTSKLIGCDGWTVSSQIYCRFRYPSGVVSEMVPIPFVWPKAMP